ncbi:chromatin accessibility complex protein 1 [Neocloeon triangulifer]|uniref:chromatin accessibility complex protein 1 n=1 Tax=Neocloeon triangulifer TaxID=2078957 RepID=UPI00286EE85A|nr:chromatin accessibility complex protein 1 [Neocloeon triangulifer]
MALNNSKQAAAKSGLQLPISRIRTIMKSSPDVESIGQDSLFLITKATELFIQSLAQRAYEDSKRMNNLGYKHVANVVQTEEEYDFLKEILPRKVLVKDISKYLNKGEEEDEEKCEDEEQEESGDEEEEG